MVWKKDSIKKSDILIKIIADNQIKVKEMGVPDNCRPKRRVLGKNLQKKSTTTDPDNKQEKN